MSATYTQGYRLGDRKVDCDMCGFTYRFSQMRPQRGFAVCPECYDIPQPEKQPLRTKQKLKRVGE